MTALRRGDGPLACLPDYVIVGHVTRDIVADGFVPGGTVTYAGLTARALGRKVGVVTSAGPDLTLGEVLPGVGLQVVPALSTSTFENVYHEGHRQQWIRAVASPLGIAEIPESWQSAPILHLAPLTGEFGPELVLALAGANFIGVTPQGWLRRWDASGRVRRAPWDQPDEVLAAVDAVVLSEEDVEYDWDTLRRWAGQTRLLVVTMGTEGCVVFESGQSWRVPAFPTVERDATGAGDVFAAAFFIGVQAGKNPVDAARYASCVASFSVEATGTAGVPTPEQVAERLATHALTISAE
ncbi:MAG TPA: PfkB family carbohydrate kinase [Chloroflexota bacterium]|nr:PfkB family carbohydrate kinase [Chloroflexota bacterium]